jgi:chromosome segregation ATPase
MDQELVQYLEGRFQRQEQGIHTLLNEGFDRQEQRFNARFDAIDGRFDRVEQRIDSHDQKFASIDQRFDVIDRHFEQVDRRFEVMDHRFEGVNDRFDELKRHTGVLVEGLRHEIQLVAEGLVMHIEVRHREDREYFDRKFEDMSTLFRSSHDHLQQQHEQLQQSQDQLRQRVDTLERKSPN